MTTVHITWHGREAAAALGRIQSAVISEAAAAVEAEAKIQAVKLIYSTPDRGRYRRTGNLLNSIGHEVQGNTAEVFAEADYATHVHEGTRHMQPRPFLRRGFARVVEALPGIIARIAARELR